jgi:hypothetical protein
MNSIRQLLRDADPLRNEPLPTDEQRNDRRRAIMAEKPQPIRPRIRFVRLAFLTTLAVAVLVLVSQFWSFISPKTYAAVRFEMRLAEESPAPGLREARVVGSNRIIYLHDEIVISNGDVSRAELIDTGDPSQFHVGLNFTETGTQKNRVATASHIGRPVAILIDGEVVMAPVVRAEIGNSAVISGNYTREEALAIVNGIGL